MNFKLLFCSLGYRYILNTCFSLLECIVYNKDWMRVIKLVWMTEMHSVLHKKNYK